MLPLQLKGARTHNLDHVSVTLQPGQVVAVTGVSGSGKSSLALDTLYAEGQRRFVESFSPYARQFLERLQRPPMDELEPVPAAIAVDRASPVKSSRSTVATMADLEPLLAALFVREATAVCPEHDREAERLDSSAAAQRVIERQPGQRVILSYPEVLQGREQYLMLRDRLAKEGYRRLWWPEGTRSIDDVAPSELDEQQQLWVVLDRVQVAAREQSRLADAFARGFERGSGLVSVTGDREPLLVRQGLSCPVCARELSEPVRGLFSYDSPLGACTECRGFGRVIGVDLDKVIPDPNKTLKQRAIRPWAGKSTTWERRQLALYCEHHGIPMDVPWKDLEPWAQQAVLHGDGGFEDEKFPGVLGWFRWLETRTYKMHVRVLLSRYRSYDECAACGGRRLNPQALSYRLQGWNLAQWHEHEVHEVLARLRELECTTDQGRLIAHQLTSRLGYLERVGLGYLSLDRQARTLSGGEAQRVTLTAALGSSLHNAMFVLDEPTVGLHPSDVRALCGAIRELAERNNVVLVVEHDAELIRMADRVLELGPGSGEQGGKLMFDGSLREALKFGGATQRACRPTKRRRRDVRTPQGWLELRGVRQNNLRDIDVRFPLGVITVVGGPSGSGKSTLVEEVLYRALARRLGRYDVERPGLFGSLEVEGEVERVVLVDQSPLGRTSRGNAATYTKAWDHIRRLFAREPMAERRGLSMSHFSFNVEGGRCEACAGEGHETVEMQFLADVRLVCPVCQGRRFKPEVLSVTCRGQSVADVLESTVDETLQRFRDCPAVLRALGPVQQLGLGYVCLGQPLSTLSGGEVQRLKLARALTEPLSGTLFVVDEPSAGLHADEVERVLHCFDNILDGGGSVVTVEHDLQVIRQADWFVEIGPGAGSNGGQLVFAGTPAHLTESDTPTAHALRSATAAAPRQRARKASSGTRAIVVRGAREHNLKQLSLEVPHQRLTVVTGPSGSGKSSLVFDVVFAEGQRRFLETLTPYARQFLPTMPKADVDEVFGVPPSVALEQRTTRAGVNSTVATVTELAHYLRLLFAKLGTPHCPQHQTPIGGVAKSVLFERVQRMRGKRALLAPVVEARKGTYLEVFNAADRDGIARAWCDGQWVQTAAPPRLVRNQEHTILLVMREAASLKDVTTAELDRALSWGNGAICLRAENGTIERFSTRSACPSCGFAVPELDPRWFSFNTKQGMCPTCEGQGVITQKRGRGKTAREVEVECPECCGARLAPIPRAVRVSSESYAQFNALTVEAFARRVGRLRFPTEQRLIAEPILKELARRADFLLEVGLGYLALERPARSLSGGEMQRLRLAAQLGSGLTGALYVLDEPTIGLHPRDTQRLIGNLKQLVGLGSTVVVVEHDADTIRAADHLVEIGPTGGREGGRLMYCGPPQAAKRKRRHGTGAQSVAPPRTPMPTEEQTSWLRLEGVTQHNLKRIDLALPLGRLTAVVGVSGSGKSTLVRGVLLPAVRERLGLVTAEPGAFERLGPLHEIARALSVDQSPIGRTPRSVPATFLGIWDHLRRLFAQSPEAQVAGFTAARFSFNTANGGRCRTCDGQGVITHEMSFLPNVVTPCPRCEGQRFEPETQRVRYLGLSIGEVLQLSAAEACEVFSHHPKIVAPLKTLVELGAGYICLGQGSHTLSGGEAQRLKLAAELTASSRHGPTLYVLDEPTTGLNQADVERLVRVLQRLLERGDTVVVIEHHPWLIAGADHVVELGPEGGEGGGRIVAQGAARQVATKPTATGRVLAPWY